MEKVQSFLETVKKILLCLGSVVLLLIITASIILYYSLISTKYPNPPDLNKVSADIAKLQVANYKLVIETLQFKQTNIYDFIVLKTLIVICNSIIVTLITSVFTQAGLQLYQTYTVRNKQNNN